MPASGRQKSPEEEKGKLGKADKKKNTSLERRKLSLGSEEDSSSDSGISLGILTIRQIQRVEKAPMVSRA